MLFNTWGKEEKRGTPAEPAQVSERNPRQPGGQDTFYWSAS